MIIYMKKLYVLFALIAVTLASCTKEVLVPADDPYVWMQNHDKGTVAYVDNYTGNYIIETYRGYAVVQPWSGISPREYDVEYAYFNNSGVQSVYNYSGDYFTRINVVSSRLGWSDALYLIDHLD